MIAGVDRLLPVERQAIGIFGDGDLGQTRFRSMMWAGAGAWMTPFAFLKAYLRRRVTITQNLAGTTSRRSETSSPISTFCLPACSASSCGSITVAIRSRWGAKPLRRRGARLSSACARPLLTWALIAAMPVSISSKTKACCSSSPFAEPSFSDRRPNRARSKAFRRSASAARCAHRRRRCGP